MGLCAVLAGSLHVHRRREIQAACEIWSKKLSAILTEYAAVLGDALGHGFDVRELVNGTRRKDEPPRAIMANMRPTLLLANSLRLHLLANTAITGLVVRAAYRATGGAKRSKHKRNEALDLDLLPSEYGLADDYYTETVRWWDDMTSKGHRIGLGLYPGRRDGEKGIRVHIDTGSRNASTTWQHYGAEVIKPPAALRILARIKGVV